MVPDTFSLTPFLLQPRRSLTIAKSEQPMEEPVVPLKKRLAQFSIARHCRRLTIWKAVPVLVALDAILTPPVCALEYVRGWKPLRVFDIAVFFGLLLMSLGPCLVINEWKRSGQKRVTAGILN